MSVQEGSATGRRDGAIGWVTFNNPEKLNAISSVMAGQALEIVRSFDADDAVRVLIIRGEGSKAFISGGDISKFKETRFNPGTAAADKQNFNDLKAALESTSKVVLAMIHGYCLGGGLALALSADLRFAATSARLGIPAAKRGIGYAIDPLNQLVDIVGPATAKDMLFSSRQIGADEALRLGLVNQVFPVETLEQETVDYANKVADNAPLSIRAAKFCIDQLLKDEVDQDRVRMQEMIDAASNSEDFREATMSFTEKRKPVFRGR